YDGWSKSPGALALLLGVPGVIVGGKRARWLAAYCAAGVACLFFYRQYARYYLPFFLPMMVLAGVAACRLRTLRKPVAVLLAVTFAYGLVLDVAAVHFKIPVALGFESRDHYLTRRVERYPAFQWVNKEIGPSGRLLFTLDPRSYYIHTPTYQNQEELRPLIGASIDEQAEWFRARHIRYLLYPKAYIESSPGYRQDGFLAMFDAWRADPERFVLIERFELERPRAGGTEVVEIYEIP
ncbi:MAG: hypothetical protein JXR94_06125, partial [Candidatus Hydrogenedentes bacterium]|nr:hypothetical protein [Candidatus Hydrogenedentota bacterium]